MASPVHQRKIGETPVSPIGFGCMRLSMPGVSPDTALSVLTRAADLGHTFWDTSDSYSTNHSLLSRWFASTGRRNEIFLATKFGIKFVDGKPEVDGSAAYVRAAVEKILADLGIETIDLLYQHRVDSKTPIEVTVAAMKELQDEGKVKYLGLSECSANTLRRACKVAKIDAAEMEYSPFVLDIESEETKFLATARELGVKIVAYSPLGRGTLTGTIKSREDLDEKDPRMAFPQFSEENLARNVEFAEALGEIANAKGCTLGQLSLAWLLAQGEGKLF